MVSQARGVITQQEKERGREFTPKQKLFLTKLIKNDFRDAQKIAREVGYATSYWQVISTLKEDIKEIAESILIGSAPEAAKLLSDVLTQEKLPAGANTKIAAAKEVLDRTGLVKEEKVQHNHAVSGGIFLIPSKSPLPERVIDVESIEDVG